MDRNSFPVDVTPNVPLCEGPGSSTWLSLIHPKGQCYDLIEKVLYLLGTCSSRKGLSNGKTNRL